MKNERRTNRVMIWLSDEERNLIETKSNYYGYKTLAGYIRDSSVFEKITHVDLNGKKEIYDAYSQHTKEIKKVIKDIRHIIKFATQLDAVETRRLNSLMFNIINNQKSLLNITEQKLSLKVWQEINRNKNLQEG